MYDQLPSFEFISAVFTALTTVMVGAVLRDPIKAVLLGLMAYGLLIAPSLILAGGGLGVD